MSNTQIESFKTSWRACRSQCDKPSVPGKMWTSMERQNDTGQPPSRDEFVHVRLNRSSVDITYHTVQSGGARALVLVVDPGRRSRAINTGNNLFYLLLAMMLSLIVLSGLLSEQCVRRLEFHRHLPEYLFANEPTTVSLWIANRKSRIPSVSLRLFDIVAGKDIDRKVRLAHLAPHSSALISYPLLVRRRGPYRFDGIRVITPFPFGLFHKIASYGSRLRSSCAQKSFPCQGCSFTNCRQSDKIAKCPATDQGTRCTIFGNFDLVTMLEPSIG